MLWTKYLCPSEFICWNPNPHCGDIRRCGLWEVIRSWMGVMSLTEKTAERFLQFSFSLHHVRIQWEDGHCKPVGGPSLRTRPCWHSDLELLTSQIVRNNCLLFKLLSLHSMFVVAPQTKTIRFSNRRKQWYNLSF